MTPSAKKYQDLQEYIVQCIDRYLLGPMRNKDNLTDEKAKEHADQCKKDIATYIEQQWSKKELAELVTEVEINSLVPQMMASKKTNELIEGIMKPDETKEQKHSD